MQKTFQTSRNPEINQHLNVKPVSQSFRVNESQPSSFILQLKQLKNQSLTQMNKDYSHDIKVVESAPTERSTLNGSFNELTSRNKVRSRVLEKLRKLTNFKADPMQKQDPLHNNSSRLS
jgi:hypothetical protein